MLPRGVSCGVGECAPDYRLLHTTKRIIDKWFFVFRVFQKRIQRPLLDSGARFGVQADWRPRAHSGSHRSHFGSRYHIGRCALRSPLLSPVGSNPGRVVSGSKAAKHGLGGARERTPGVTVAILAQGTTSGDALCAALFCLPSVRTPDPGFTVKVGWTPRSVLHSETPARALEWSP